MKHTPGPWHINGIDTIMSIGANRTVAKVFNPQNDTCLIAAAPELLEALSDIEALADRETHIKTGCKVDLSELLPDILKIARLAIAKAGGR